MSSLFSSLNVSLTGLRTITGQMQLVADNIANANNPGYSKKSSVLQAVQLGGQPGGTQIIGYTRATDLGTTRALQDAATDNGYYSTQSGYLQRVQNILGNDTSTPTLASSITNFSAAWAEMAAEPESSVQQRSVVQAGQNLANTVQSVATKVEELDRQIRDDIDNTLSSLNAYLEQVAQLNTQIATGTTLNQPVGNLQDQRDEIVQKIAAITNVQVYERDRGQISLATKSGYVLLDLTNRQTLTYDGTNVTSTSDPSQSLNDILSGGSLQAAVEFRADSSPANASDEGGSEVIRKLRSQLDAIVTAFTSTTSGTFAATYDAATPLNSGELDTGFFTGTDRTTFAVNSALVAGTSKVKQAASKDVIDMFNDGGQSFTAQGLSLTNATYSDLGTQILTNFQQSASNVRQLGEVATSQLNVLKQRLANITGVNTDAELVTLTALQNSYNASAKVISIINTMFDKLEEATR